MARLNWQRSRDRVLERGAHAEEREVESAFNNRLFARKPKRRARRQLRGNLMTLRGEPAALVDHARGIPPRAGEMVTCTQGAQEGTLAGMVVDVEWTRDQRSLVRVRLS